MSNDDRLVPRGSAIPVSVRRPLGAPVGGAPLDPALLPPQSPSPAGPPAAPSPQIIYINNAPAPLPVAPTPPAVPSQTIHHHHYNTTNYTQPAGPRISLRIPTPPSHSALGMASLALGIIACVVCWVPWLGLIAVPVGTIGAVLGVLGILVSLLFRKSSPSLPFAGLFICCLAAGISIASTKTLPYWQRQLQNTLSTVLPKTIAPPRDSSPAPAPPPIPALRTGGLFDSTGTVVPSAPQPAAPKLVPNPTPTPPKATLNPTIAAARDQLIAAQKACDARTMQIPEYISAVKTAADARTREAQLRESSPGSSDLMQASQDMIKADNAVSDKLARAEASDPSVAAARQALMAARSVAP